MNTIYTTELDKIETKLYKSMRAATGNDRVRHFDEWYNIMLSRYPNGAKQFVKDMLKIHPDLMDINAIY